MAKEKLHTQYYFPPNLQNQLAKISDYPLTLVEAPSGFGKTTAVREYLASMEKEGKGDVRWYTCFGESPDKTWSGICNLFRNLDCTMADALANLGGPEREILPDVVALLQQYHPPKLAYLVIDNYQFFATPIQKALLTALSACRSKNLHIVVITQPLDFNSNDVETTQSGDAYHIITDEDFIFDHASIAKYCHLGAITITAKAIEHIQSISHGWIAAIRLLLKHYTETGQLIASRAISALVETAVWNKLSPGAREFMLGVSLLNGHTQQQAVIMNGSSALPKSVVNLGIMEFFIRYVPDKKSYFLHAILRDYLLERFGEQSKDFIHTMLRRAASACLAENDYWQAARFFLQVADYDAILSMPFTDQYFFNHQGEDIIQFFSRLFEECPLETLRRHPLMVITVGIQFYKKGMREDYVKVLHLMAEFIQNPPASLEMSERELYRVKGEFEMLFLISQFNNLTAMYAHNRKAHEYLSRVSVPPRSRIFIGNPPWAMGIPSVLSAYWNQSGGLQDALSAMGQFLPLYSELAGGHGAGSEIVMHAEAAFARGDDAEAEALCYKAMFAAQNAGQRSNHLCAELILARIGIARGEEKIYTVARKNIKYEINRAQETALTHAGEMCLAYLDLLFGKTDGLASWLRSPESIRRNLYSLAQPHAMMLHCWMLLLEKRWAELYALTEIAMETVHAMHYPLLQVYHLIFLARAKLEKKHRGDAEAHLREALGIALPDSVYLPFAEHAEALLPLLEKLKGSFDSKQVQKCINLCHRWSRGTAELRKALPGDPHALTPRQAEFLSMVAKGKSNAQIAAHFAVSLDNVNKLLSSAYDRLKVRNRIEAVQTFLSLAKERRL